MSERDDRVPAAVPPLGQPPLGQAPLGQAPLGQAPPRQPPLGQAPPGQAPLGQAPPAPYATEPRAPDLPAHLDPRGPALPPHLDPRRGRPRDPGPRDLGPGSRALVPPRRSRAARALSLLAVALSATLFLVSAVGYGLYSRYDGNIARIPGLTEALPGLTKPAGAGGGARNILLVGSDTRDTTGGQFQGTGAEFTTGQRSDTVILAHLYGGSDQAQLVSFPRDSWVTIPAHTDPASGQLRQAHDAKLNAAIEEGGPALLIATLEQLTDIRVDSYVQIDFAGFQSMVDTLGGVEVCLNSAAREKDSGIDLPAGRQVVRGEQALAFVRQRKELPNGDIDRIRRQQAFIGSITRKVLSSGTLLDPVRLDGFLRAATSAVQVDEDLDGSGLTQLALRLRNFSAGGVVFSTVPFTSLSATRAGQSVVLLDEARARVLFEQLERDEEPPRVEAAAPAPAPLTVAPRAVRVSVLNAAGTAGLGRTVADDLTEGGFRVVGAPGNRGTGVTGTVVRFGPDRAEAARTLAAAVPGATLREDDALGDTLELVVGSSYRGTVPVSVAPSAAATPAAGTPPTPTSAAEAGCVD